MQNGLAESFNGQLRVECLNEHLFTNLRHARQLIGTKRDDYHQHRPHMKLASPHRGIPQPITTRPKPEQI